MLILEYLFKKFDGFLKIDNLPIIKVLIPITLIYILFFSFLFKLLGRNILIFEAWGNAQTYNNKTKKINIIDFALFLFLLSIMAYSLAKIVLSMGLGITPISYIIVSLITPPIIFILVRREASSFLLLFILVSFGTIYVPIQVNIVNGVNIQETISDTINIFANAHWRFSYHNPVYDALPYDSVFTVILMSIFNIEEPTNVLIKTLMESGIVISVILTIIVLASYLGFSFEVGVLNALFILSLPYIAFYIPPTNFSTAFIIMFITMLIRLLISGSRASDLIVIGISFTAGILAHEMSVLILLIPIIIFIINIIVKESKNIKLLSKIIVLSIVVFLLFFAYTGALESTYGYLRVYTKSFSRFGYIGVTQSRFQATIPRTIDAFYPLPIAVVVAFLLNIFIKIISYKNKYIIIYHLKDLKYQFLIAIYIGMIMVGLVAGFSLITPHTLTRHSGVFLYLFVGLGAMPILSILFNDIHKEKTVRTIIIKKILIIFIILTIIGGLITPHNLPSHYSWIQSPLPRDYTLSEFLVNKGLLSGNVTFVLRTEKIYTGASQALWVAWLKHVMVHGWKLSRYYTNPLSSTTYHIETLSSIDYKRLISSSSKIYSSYYRNVYVGS